MLGLCNPTLLHKYSVERAILPLGADDPLQDAPSVIGPIEVCQERRQNSLPTSDLRILAPLAFKCGWLAEAVAFCCYTMAIS